MWRSCCTWPTAPCTRQRTPDAIVWNPAWDAPPASAKAILRLPTATSGSKARVGADASSARRKASVRQRKITTTPGDPATNSCCLNSQTRLPLPRKMTAAIIRRLQMVRRAFIPVAFFVCCIVAALAQDLPKLSRPEEAGFSSERLNRITQFFQSEVDQGTIPGAVLVVGRNGKMVYRQAVGYQDREKKRPMKVDSVFRIFSMTKPVTTVAVMMLAEEGKIDVMAPVAQYLPEFKDVKVGVESMDPAGGKPMLKLEAPGRPMTVQDLLRHTSGLVY